MAKYITVLNSTVNNKYWKAVQVAESLEAIRKNKFYTAGVSTSLPKNSGDVFIEDKTVTEVSTQTTAGAKVYRLAPKSITALRLLNK